MNRSMLKKMIQQEIARVEEDYLVDPSKVSSNFAYTTREEDVCPSCNKSPCACDDLGDVCPSCGMNPCRCISGNKNPYKLSCDSCGGVLVMQEGCGCGGSKDLSSQSIYMNVLDGMEGMARNYEEEDAHHDGAYMAKSQLHMIEKYARKLQQMIPQGDDLDDWMRSHISQAADDLSEVYHKLEYKSHKEF